MEVFVKALEILEDWCECDASCYQCVRSFSNRFEHGTLDRFIGASLLRYVLNGELEETPESLARREQSITKLVEDLSRQGANYFGHR